MRKSNREINVFSLSAMDLFASAMGAFMLISLVALPYYLNAGDERQQAAQLREQNAEAQNRLEQTREQLQEERERRQQVEEAIRQQERQNQQQQQQAERIGREKANAGLVVMAKWETPADMDMYVVSAQGHEYGPDKHNRLPAGSGDGARRPHYPDEDAEFSLDANGTNPAIPAARGDSGIEVWLSIGAGPGEYRIYVQRCSPHEDRNPYTRVDLTIIYRDEYLYKTIPRVVTDGDRNSRPPRPCAVVTISAEGVATLR